MTSRELLLPRSLALAESAGDAVCGALAPRTPMKWFGVDIERNTLSAHYLHGVGASAAATAVSTYMAVTGKASIERTLPTGSLHALCPRLP